jgi:asparagine synthase (glutamine-hydrolysing)
MCGIAGCWGNYDATAIQKAADSIKHRGPDAFNSYTDGNLTFLHHRLSILDLSDNGAQPYHYEHLSMVYNGEVYNFEDVKKELIEYGYNFVSKSDTEVIIKAFHKWGIEAVHHFIGMFALALYDKNDSSLYLFRDRFGVKPLYYTTTCGIAFGSELRSVIPFMQDKQINHDSVHEYFRFGYISEEKTIYTSVKKLLPGYYLHYKNGKAKTYCYWDVRLIASKPQPVHTDAEWKEILHKELIDAFKMRMISDVPVGVFLSGGIDSSLVTAILTKHYGNIHTFTIGFNNEKYNEAPYAKKVAEYLGTTHTEFTLDINDAYEMLHKFYDIYDEPYADSSGIPTAIVSRLAAEKGVKVVLAANGGDELFAGYKHYQTTLEYYKKFKSIPTLLRSLVRYGSTLTYKSGLLSNWYSNNTEHRVAVVNELLKDSELGSFYNSFLANQGELEINNLLKHHGHDSQNTELIKDDLTGLLVYDINHYLADDLLVKMDRATMFNSIEGREPFLDHRLVKIACQIPAGLKWRNNESKWILKEILAEYIPKDFFNRPKMGFSIPIFNWFSQHMDVLFETYLQKEKIEKTGIFNYAEVLKEYNKYKWNKQHNKEYNIEKMWRVLSFMMWWDKWHEKL